MLLMSFEHQLKKFKIPGLSALALSAFWLSVKPVLSLQNSPPIDRYQNHEMNHNTKLRNICYPMSYLSNDILLLLPLPAFIPFFPSATFLSSYIEPKPPITLWSYKDTPIRDIAYCFIEDNILPHHITYLVHSCWIDALLWIAILPSWVDKWGKPGEILYRFVPVSI